MPSEHRDAMTALFNGTGTEISDLAAAVQVLPRNAKRAPGVESRP